MPFNIHATRIDGGTKTISWRPPREYRTHTTGRWWSRRRTSIRSACERMTDRRSWRTGYSLRPPVADAAAVSARKRRRCCSSTRTPCVHDYTGLHDYGYDYDYYVVGCTRIREVLRGGYMKWNTNENGQNNTWLVILKTCDTGFTRGWRGWSVIIFEKKKIWKIPWKNHDFLYDIIWHQFLFSENENKIKISLNCILVLTSRPYVLHRRGGGGGRTYLHIITMRRNRLIRFQR